MMSVHRLDRTPWRDHLQMNANGGYKANLFNACIAFREAAEFRGAISYDEFSMRTRVLSALPWSDDASRWWTNFDDNYATEWLQANSLPIGRETAQQAIETVAHENRSHPVRDWLNSLEWDGEPRIHDWLTYFLGAKRSDYIQHVGRAWLISAVARIMRPGCKVDHMLVLEGPQGVRKSTAVRAITGDQWFTDELAEFGSKDAGLQMRGVWVIELAELDNLSRAEASRIKAFMSRSTDRFRPPYGARLVEAPRECVFCGTVNQDEYLKDETGNRRFWPVRVGQHIDIDGLAAEREQLWAEAVAAYRYGEIWWIEDDNVKSYAARHQQERNESDAWMTPVAEWASRQVIKKFSTTQILTDAVGKRISDITNVDYKRVGKVMKELKYIRTSVSIGGIKTKGWIPLSDWKDSDDE